MNIIKCVELKKNFLDYLEKDKNLAFNTLKSYHLDLEQFVNFWKNIEEKETQDMSLDKIIVRYNTALLHKSLDKRSIARKMSCLSSFLRFLQLNDIFVKIDFQRPHIENRAPEFLEKHEISFLINGLSNKSLPSQKPLRDKLILEVLYSTGIRCSEVVNIKMQDIDWDNKKIFIHTKNKKTRIIPFNEETEIKLKTYLERERLDRGEHLFINHKGDRLTTRSVQRICAMFERFLTEGKKITPHILRHSFAIHKINDGTDIKIVEEMLGLTTLSMTKQYKKTGVV